MLDSQAAGNLVVRPLLASASAANTAGATSGNGFWADTQDLDGQLVVLASPGAITGSLTVKLQVADDANGTNAQDVPGAVFAASTANVPASMVVPKASLAKRYLGVVGTIVTGPALLGVNLIGGKKYQ